MKGEGEREGIGQRERGRKEEKKEEKGPVKSVKPRAREVAGQPLLMHRF